MKKVIACCACVVIIGVALSGCATVVPMGAAFAEIKMPVAVTANPSLSPKVGTAYAKSFFGVVAIGDASIEKAMKNGNIKKIHYVDWHVKNIAGVANYKLMVYGE